MENSLDKPSEKQGLSKRKEKKKRWWKEKANREKNNKELKKAKDLIAGKTIVQMEGSDDFSSWYGYQFVNNSKFKTPEESLKKIKQVTASDIKRVAQKLFVNSGLNLAIIGDVKNKQKIKNILTID